MAILIGMWESILVVAIVVSLTMLALWWYWRRRMADLCRTLGNQHQTELAALRQTLDNQHQTELAALRQTLDNQYQTELAALRQTHYRQQQTEIRDMIREFKHQATHCLRPIKDSLYLIKEKTQGQADACATEWLHRVEKSLEDVDRYEWRLTRLIENMAFVVRLEAPDFSLGFSQIKLDVIVSDVVDEFQCLASKGRTRLAWRAIPEEFPHMTANENSLRQVFINLIDNAIKYCGEKDEIDVALEANEDKNVIYARVSDTGPGIPQDDWELIFQKGYTVEGARGRRPKEGGQGLGLYIAKLVVEKHKGNIDVASELGKGTTFTITLPIQRI